MTLLELLIIAVGLAMDAFAVSICKGLSVQKILPRHSWSVGLWFGGFQALMPLLGYLLGSNFAAEVAGVDHWIAFGLLLLIGGNMIREAVEAREVEPNPDFSPYTMFLLAVATSIDALAVGVTFAFLKVAMWQAVALIGITTMLLSMVGLRVGNLFGNRYKEKAEWLGGVILILIGGRILIDHLF